MFKKIVGYLMLFYLIVSLALSLAGVTYIDLMRSGNTFFRTCAMRFNDWGAWEIPNIVPLEIGESVSGFAAILGAFKRFANFFISICNFAINFMNMIIQLCEFIFVIVSMIFKPYELVVPSVPNQTVMLLALAR